MWLTKVQRVIQKKCSPTQTHQNNTRTQISKVWKATRSHTCWCFYQEPKVFIFVLHMFCCLLRSLHYVGQTGLWPRSLWYSISTPLDLVPAALRVRSCQLSLCSVGPLITLPGVLAPCGQPSRTQPPGPDARQSSYCKYTHCTAMGRGEVSKSLITSWDKRLMLEIRTSEHVELKINRLKDI